MAKPRTDNVGFGELHVQLRIISKLLAAQLRATTSQQEMIRLLASTGATAAEIADVLGTTPATVNATFQRLKRIAAKAKPQESSGEGDTQREEGVSE